MSSIRVDFNEKGVKNAILLLIAIFNTFITITIELDFSSFELILILIT